MMKKQKKIEKKEQMVRAGVKRVRKEKIEQNPSGITCLVDLCFSDLMTEKEITSTINQMQFCYSDNRTRPLSLDLHASSVSGVIKECWQQRAPDFHKWQVI